VTPLQIQDPPLVVATEVGSVQVKLIKGLNVGVLVVVGVDDIINPEVFVCVTVGVTVGVILGVFVLVGVCVGVINEFKVGVLVGVGDGDGGVVVPEHGTNSNVVTS
jgi:hypothetical protein